MNDMDTGSAYPPAARMQEKTAQLSKELKIETKNLNAQEINDPQQGGASPLRPNYRSRGPNSREGGTALSRLMSGKPTQSSDENYSPGPRTTKASYESLKKELSRKLDEAMRRAEDSEHKCRDMQREMQKRQESYLRREATYKSKISHLEKNLNDYEGNDQWTANYIISEKSQTRREQILHMHNEIQRALGFLHTKKKSAKERSMSRIGEEPSEMQSSIVAPRTESASGAGLTQAQQPTEKPSEKPSDSDWAVRLREQEIFVKGERDRDSEKQMLVENLATMRQALEQQQLANEELKNNARSANEMSERIRAQFEVQEDDREILLRQVETLRSENERLKGAVGQGFKRQASDVFASPRLSSGVPSPSPKSNGTSYRPMSGLSGRSGSKADKAEAARAEEISRAKSYEEVVDGLKQLLLQERGRTKKARAAHMAELQQRTKLQTLMRQAIEDVRLQRSGVSGDMGQNGPASVRGSGQHRRPASAHPAITISRGGSRDSKKSITTMLPFGSTTDDLMDEHSRQDLVDALLAKEEVMKLLFDRTFPGVDASPAGKEETIQRLVQRQEAEDAARTARPGPGGRRGEGGGQSTRDLSISSTRSLAGPAGGAGAQAAMNRQALNSTTGVSRPWVMDVDGMLSDFLGGGGPAGAAPPTPSDRNRRGSSRPF